MKSTIKLKKKLILLKSIKININLLKVLVIILINLLDLNGKDFPIL